MLPMGFSFFFFLFCMSYPRIDMRHICLCCLFLYSISLLGIWCQEFSLLWCAHSERWNLLPFIINSVNQFLLRYQCTLHLLQILLSSGSVITVVFTIACSSLFLHSSTILKVLGQDTHISDLAGMYLAIFIPAIPVSLPFCWKVSSECHSMNEIRTVVMYFAGNWNITGAKEFHCNTGNTTTVFFIVFCNIEIE